MQQLTFLSEAPPANPSLSRASEAAWQMSAATWRSNFFAWLTACAPAGWFGRTSPVSCHRATDGTLGPSSAGWQNSGMGGPTASLTLSISDSPSDASVCSLSDVLETGEVPRGYYLSGTACRGILRRAEKRGKNLPPALQAALEAVAAQT